MLKSGFSVTDPALAQQSHDPQGSNDPDHDNLCSLITRSARKAPPKENRADSVLDALLKPAAENPGIDPSSL